MGTTPGGLPYPEPTDPLAGVADAIKALALGIDPKLWETTFTAVPAPVTGWTNTNGLAAYIRTRDGRWVFFRGTLDRSSTDGVVGGNPVMTLPVGVRPAKWYRSIIACSTNPWAVRMQIDPSGVCTMSSPVIIPVGGYIHLDGIMFATFA